MATATTAVAVPPSGLTEAEAARRLQARGAAAEAATSRSYASIVRANVFTIFNLILAVAGAVTIAFGEWQDALFLGILFFNTDDRDRPGGAGQAGARPARRARRADGDRRPGRRCRGRSASTRSSSATCSASRPATRSSPTGTRRDRVRPRVDESILTGESRPVDRAARRRRCAPARSSAEGIGEFEVTAVGEESYASKIAGEARSFRHPRSPLERALNNLLLILVAVIVPLGLLLGYALYHRHTKLSDAVPTAVAAMVTIVPEGLILLTSLTFAVAALRMARRGALVQQLNALESLASVDLVCTDKTGTLTEPEPKVLERRAGAGHDEGRARAGARSLRRERSEPDVDARGDPHGVPGRGRAPDDRGAVLVAAAAGARSRLGDDKYVLGAPELFPLDGLKQRAESEAAEGRRVVAIGTTTTDLEHAKPEDGPPPDLHAARHRLDRRATAAERARDGRVPARAEHRAARALRRPAGDRGRDRPRGRRAGDGPAARREQPADEPGRARAGRCSRPRSSVASHRRGRRASSRRCAPRAGTWR